jgi:23S rRNA pseudouridine2605 synthase
MRLNRYLAAAGFGSRRACEELILSRRVRMNGDVVAHLATTVSEGDVVSVDGTKVEPKSAFYYLLHKPRGYHCTASDPRGRPTVFQLLPEGLPRLFYVGRLDADSEGLVLMTNDGDLAQRLAHPSHHVEKEYEVYLESSIEPGQVPKLLRGFVFEEGRARMADVQILAPRKIRVVLNQGMKRQIRRMLYRLGIEVRRLVRTRIGPLKLLSLPAGSCRPLSHREINDLKKWISGSGRTSGQESRPAGHARDRRPSSGRHGLEGYRRPRR